MWIGEQTVDDGPSGQPGSGVRLLIADDDAIVRSLFVTLLEDVPGVSSVVDASDGHIALLTARRLRCDIAILDFNMPRLDGVDAALLLRRDRPSTRVAVHSSDPRGLEERAAGLGLALFDKLDFEGLRVWIERQAADLRGRSSGTVAAFAPRRGFACSFCSYGVVSREPPPRCPMCNRETSWDPEASETPEDAYSSLG